MNKIKNIIFVLIFILLFTTISCKKEQEIDIPVDKILNIKVSEKSQLEFNQGEFDLSKIYITLIYETFEEDITLLPQYVTTDITNINEVLSKEIEIEYKSFTCKTTITMIPKIELTKIELNPISILEFTQNNFEPSYIVIDAIYSNNEIEEIELTEDLITDGLSDINTVGKHQLTIKYENCTLNIDVNILPLPNIKSVNVSKWSNLTHEQNNIKYNEIYLDITYEDESVQMIPTNKEMFEEDLNNVGVFDTIIKYKEFLIDVEIVITPEIIYDDFIYESLPYNSGYIINGYVGGKENVVIPSTYNNLPVVEIASRAFYQNNYIRRVVIPKSINVIGEAAFYKAGYLSSVIIENPNITIENYALASCKLIYLAGEVNESWPEKWYDLQHSYIHENMNTSTIKFDNTFEYFQKDDNLVVSNYFGNSLELTVPNLFSKKSPSIIGGACFKGNEDLTTVTLPDSIIELGTYAFAECSSIISLNLSNNLEIIGDYAIRGCTILEYLELPNSLKQVNQNAFNMCSSLKELIFPKGTTSIGGYAFAWCVSLTKIYIPSSVINMGAGACYACSKATIYLETDNIPSTWTEGWNMSNRPIKYNQTI